MKKFLGIFSLLFFVSSVFAQRPGYWQQQADYDMNINFDVKKHQFNGSQKLTYVNNSPDTLNKVFYHLYFNAFQPNSMMDVRSRTIADADRRMGSRISKLKEDEIGYQKITKLLQNNKAVQTNLQGTILEVTLAEPILPGSTHEFDMEFNGQVPLQIRRSGRNSSEGIEYTMTQWYPKIAEYDFQGWHAYDYIAREFHSPWGDYDVKITIDSDYVLAGSGVIQNPNEVGHGYQAGNHEIDKQQETTWHFQVDNVIDFAWAADPDYKHEIVDVPGGPKVHYFYQENSQTREPWRKMIEEYTIPLFQTMSEKYGQYPYPVYSVIQGGDGGMEYPLCTMITGERSFESLYGVTSHELAHSWFQMMMASNEALYAWMDEGMTSFADAEVTKIVFNQEGNPHAGAIRAYTAFTESGLNEPANQHSDHFNTNRAYSFAAYVKGQLLLSQLKYIMGEEVFGKAMLRYYDTWKFKHPTPNDFIRILEKESGLQLQWFMRNWLNTTRTIDYAVKNVKSATTENVTAVTLENKGTIPMPVEVTIEFNDGRPDKIAYIPLNEMYGSKDISNLKGYEEKPIWNWVNEEYELMILAPKNLIKSIQIDAKGQTADVKPDNNSWGVVAP